MNLTDPSVTPGVGILMMLASGAALAFAAGALLLAALRRRPAPVAPIARWLGAWAAIYAVVLVTTSAKSRPRELDVGDTQKFCGFYIDCHSEVAVAGVETFDTLSGMAAVGRFHVVTLRIGSDAVVAHMRLSHPQVTVRDADGGRYERSAAGEAALARARGPQPLLTDSVGPGGSYLTAVVFDLPRDIAEPRLRVTMGWWADRVLEFFLVGDEDSFLHKRTTFRIDS